MFSLKHQEYDPTSKEKLGFVIEEIKGHFSVDGKGRFDGKNPYSIDNFPLPGFMSFNRFDKTRKKYEEERQFIIDFYKGKDFIETTLNVLTN